jgi:hypothetical protein
MAMTLLADARASRVIDGLSLRGSQSSVIDLHRIHRAGDVVTGGGITADGGRE